MANIPADIESAQAAGRIPSGISLDYLAQTRDQSAKIAILFVGCLTIVIVVARCYARVFLVKSFGLDDALAAFTLLFYIAILVLCTVLIDLGSGRHIEYIQYVLNNSQVNQTEVLDFVMHILYTTALFVCRLSGLAFYHRLASRHTKLSIAIKVAVGFLIIAYLAQAFLLIFHCVPVTGLWPYAWQPEIDDYTCITWGEVYSVNSALSLTSDLILLVIPSMLIHLLHVSRKRRLQLSLVLFPGVLVIIISCVRIYLVVYGQWAADGSWAYDPMLAIETSEIGGTLIALSIPGLKPLFGSWISLIGAFTTSPTSKSSEPQHKSYGHNTGRSLKPKHTANSFVELKSYDAQFDPRRGNAASSLTVSAKHELKNDGSSDDLLLDADLPSRAYPGVTRFIEVRQETSVLATKASDLE